MSPVSLCSSMACLAHVWHRTVRIVGISQLLFHRLNRFDNLGRGTQSDRIRRQALGHNSPGAHSAPAADRHTREDRDISPNPAIVLYPNRVAELDELDAGQDARLVPGAV